MYYFTAYWRPLKLTHCCSPTAPSGLCHTRLLLKTTHLSFLPHLSNLSIQNNTCKTHFPIKWYCPWLLISKIYIAFFFFPSKWITKAFSTFQVPLCHKGDPGLIMFHHTHGKWGKLQKESAFADYFLEFSYSKIKFLNIPVKFCKASLKKKKKERLLSETTDGRNKNSSFLGSPVTLIHLKTYTSTVWGKSRQQL